MDEVPLVTALKARMQWQQTRQKVLAENVANANTPGFRPRDLKDPTRSAAAPVNLGMTLTSGLHLAGLEGGASADTQDGRRFETRPSGNAVNVEDEMLKVAQNGSDYQLAASLYQKTLTMLRLAAVGK